MTRTITVTGGFSGSAVVDVTDTLKQLGTATFRMTLAPVGQDDPPIVGAGSWQTVTPATSADGAATIALPVDDTTALGAYNVAFDVVIDNRHEAGWAMDRRDPQRRALLVVT